jgi:ribosomal protein L37AE/L43A
MSSEKKPLAGGIFANALASTPRYVQDDAGAGMHNTLVCDHCGAARERDRSEDGPLTCRYCGHAFVVQKR